jgi:NDP-hexose 2,3-enoyl reductase
MEQVQLGRAGLRVSRLALGTMNFGPVTEERDAHLILDRALEGGITLVDTADVYGADPTRQVYGWQEGKGRTEEIIGRWLAQDRGRRDRIVLATKAYGQMAPPPDAPGLSARNLLRRCEGSLRRLRTDHIDLYQLHHVDRGTPWDEIWEALSQLRQQGKVRYFGTSNHAGWHIAQGQEAALARGLLGFVSEQSLYNLMERTVELEVLPACRHYGLGLITYSPLHGGLLGGVLQRTDGARSAIGRAAAGLADHRDRIERYEGLCAELGHRPAEVALAWLLHKPGVTAPVVGARTIEQLDNSLRAVEIELGDEALHALDDLFPGPGGPAPEAYAW